MKRLWIRGWIIPKIRQICRVSGDPYPAPERSMAKFGVEKPTCRWLFHAKFHIVETQEIGPNFEFSVVPCLHLAINQRDI